jgi:hypothetical protein
MKTFLILIVGATLALVGCSKTVEQQRAACGTEDDHTKQARANLAGITISGTSVDEARAKVAQAIIGEAYALHHACLVAADPVGQAKIDAAEEAARELVREAERAERERTTSCLSRVSDGRLARATTGTMRDAEDAAAAEQRCHDEHARRLAEKGR